MPAQPSARPGHRFRSIWIAAIALAGCASPSPEFAGTSPTHVTVAGTEVAVWQRGNRAQAIRMGRARPGTHAAIRAHMMAATEAATGCAIAVAEGDSGVMNMRLDCPDQPVLRAASG